MKEYKYTIDGKEYKVAIGNISEDFVAEVNVNGEDYKVQSGTNCRPEKKKVVVSPQTAKAASDDAPAASSANVNVNNAVKAPLPGVVTEIKVNVGDTVAVGDTVVVLEAMKMANNLTAEKAGKVTAILVKVGENVLEDTPLVAIE